jgi:putative restriction endonuclease
VSYLAPEAAADAAEQPAYAPTGKDERERAMRQIATRRGQPEFRQERVQYGDRCVISGCTLVHALEAAHINPYRGPNENNPENGLLLRADLHTLFDLDLIGIEPETLIVALHPSVVGKGYDEVNGAALLCGMAQPSKTALVNRWTAFESRCQSAAAAAVA